MTNKREQLLSRIGENIKKARLEQGLTQEALADIADLHRTFVGAVERGERNVSILTLAKIAEALDVETETLLTPHNKDD